MKNTGIVIASLIGGALVGSALAILFAPQSGSETRKQLKDLIDEEIDKVKEAAEEVKKQIMGTAEQLEEQIEQAACKCHND